MLRRLAPMMAVHRYAVPPLLWMLLAVPAAFAENSRLLVVHEARSLAALAAAGDEVWFAVVPPEAWQPRSEAPPVFTPVRAEGHRAAGSVVTGLWTRKGLKWLGTLPGEVARGGRRAYGVSDILLQGGGAWVTGPLNVPERPIGRYYLARLDARGRARIMAEDGGPAAVALAAAPQRPCVARNPEPGSPTPVARLACPGRWSKTFRVTGPGAFFSWTPGHGLAPANGGVWAVARLQGTVRVDDAEARSPTLGELPFLADDGGGIPPASLAPLRQLLDTRPMPPLGAVLVLRVDARGRLASLATLAPDAIRVGVTTGDMGMDPARIDGYPLIASDGTGRAFVFGRYEHAVRAGGKRIVTGDAGASGTHCFMASWDATGALRWLRDIPRCTGDVIGLVAGGERLIAVTAHERLLLDPGTGAVQARMALPGPRQVRRPPDFRWVAADVAGNRLVLGGIFRGDAELLGRRLNEKRTSVVIAQLPLVSHGLN